MTNILNFTKKPNFFDKVSTESSVEILIGSEESEISQKNTWLLGAFRIKDDNLNHLTKLHKALVITWTSNGVSKTKNLVNDTFIFPDDEEIDNKFRIGYFNYDLSDWLSFNDLQEYYITVSLHNHISNTIYLAT